MDEYNYYVSAFGRRFYKPYVELLALFVGAIIYGYCKSELENDWYAVGIASIVLLALKVVIEWLAKKQSRANDNT